MATEAILCSEILQRQVSFNSDIERRQSKANSLFLVFIPQRVDEVEFGQLVQVEDSGGKPCDQNVSGLVVGSCCQMIKIPLLIKKVPGKPKEDSNCLIFTVNLTVVPKQQTHYQGTNKLGVVKPASHCRADN